MKISARNQLKGTVSAIAEGAVNGVVSIDLGSTVVKADITMEAINDLGLADVLRFHFRSSRHHPVSNHQTHSDICAARSINCRSCGR